MPKFRGSRDALSTFVSLSSFERLNGFPYTKLCLPSRECCHSLCCSIKFNSYITTSAHHVASRPPARGVVVGSRSLTDLSIIRDVNLNEVIQSRGSNADVESVNNNVIKNRCYFSNTETVGVKRENMSLKSPQKRKACAPGSGLAL